MIDRNYFERRADQEARLAAAAKHPAAAAAHLQIATAYRARALSRPELIVEAKADGA